MQTGPAPIVFGQPGGLLPPMSGGGSEAMPTPDQEMYMEDFPIDDGVFVDDGMMDFVDVGLPQDEMVDIELPQDEMVVVDIPQEQSTTQTASDEDAATGDTKSASDGDTKVAGDDDKAKEETSYTPWIIGGVVTTVVIGGIVYMNSKKKKAI
jgi:hypothetical protein